MGTCSPLNDKLTDLGLIQRLWRITEDPNRVRVKIKSEGPTKVVTRGTEKAYTMLRM